MEQVERVSAALETNVNTARRELRETVLNRLKITIEQMERESVQYLTKIVNIQRHRQARLDDIKAVARKRLKISNESREYAN